MNYLPKDISTEHSFYGSDLKNTECETVLRNIVILQKETNAEEWTPFSWKEYKKLCTHRVTNMEKTILSAFVHGGKPFLHTSAFLESGWLDFDGKKYSITSKTIKMLGEKYAIYKLYQIF
jgi:hypothetical protein